eukprot:3120480-Rhodomonas_salina.1
MFRVIPVVPCSCVPWNLRGTGFLAGQVAYPQATTKTSPFHGSSIPPRPDTRHAYYDTSNRGAATAALDQVDDPSEDSHI